MSSVSEGKTAQIVAVTTSVSREDDTYRYRLNQSYVQAVENARLVPVLIPPLRDVRSVERVLDRVDGLVLTGGGDIAPLRYGAESRNVRSVSAPRDATEIELVLEARRRGIPTLGICRGIQILNVAFGGSLVQDIGTDWPGALAHDQAAPRTARSHSISLEAGSIVREALGAPAMEVNSLHHQAVDRLADGFVVTARSGDGVVEAIESRIDGWWAIGVQWHPEDLVAAPDSPDRGLFNALRRAIGE